MSKLDLDSDVSQKQSGNENAGAQLKTNNAHDTHAAAAQMSSDEVRSATEQKQVEFSDIKWTQLHVQPDSFHSVPVVKTTWKALHPLSGNDLDDIPSSCDHPPPVDATRLPTASVAGIAEPAGPNTTYLDDQSPGSATRPSQGLPAEVISEKAPSAKTLPGLGVSDRQIRNDFDTSITDLVPNDCPQRPKIMPDLGVGDRRIRNDFEKSSTIPGHGVCPSKN